MVVGMTVPMTPAEIQLAHWYGMSRLMANQGSQDKGYYNRSAMVADREAHPAAVLCEMAVAKWLSIYYVPTLWAASAHKDNKHLADVGTNIEVRRVRNPQTGPAIRSTDRGKVIVGVYLPDDVADDWGELEVLGWVAVPLNATKEDFLKHYKVCVGAGQKYFRCPIENLIPPNKKILLDMAEQLLDTQEKVG